MKLVVPGAKEPRFSPKQYVRRFDGRLERPVTYVVPCFKIAAVLGIKKQRCFYAAKYRGYKWITVRPREKHWWRHWRCMTETAAIAFIEEYLASPRCPKNARLRVAVLKERRQIKRMFRTYGDTPDEQAWQEWLNLPMKEEPPWSTRVEPPLDE